MRENAVSALFKSIILRLPSVMYIRIVVDVKWEFKHILEKKQKSRYFLGGFFSAHFRK